MVDSRLSPPSALDVSVLIATNRVDAWLDAAILSALQQESVSLEVVLVLDGVSAPPTAPWARDARVRTVHSAYSRGLASALNLGASMCSAPLIARLDSDDVMLPGRLRQQVDYMRSNGDVILLGTDAEIVDHDGTILGKSDSHKATSLNASLLKRNVLIHPSVMFRRDHFNEVGGYNESLHRMEDYELWLRLACQGAVGKIERALIQYRVHDTQMSRVPPVLSAYARVLRSRWRLRGQLSASIPRQLTFDLRTMSAYAAWRLGLRKLRYLATGPRKDPL